MAGKGGEAGGSWAPTPAPPPPDRLAAPPALSLADRPPLRHQGAKRQPLALSDTPLLRVPPFRWMEGRQGLPGKRTPVPPSSHLVPRLEPPMGPHPPLQPSLRQPRCPRSTPRSLPPACPRTPARPWMARPHPARPMGAPMHRPASRLKLPQQPPMRSLPFPHRPSRLPTPPQLPATQRPRTRRGPPTHPGQHLRPRSARPPP